MLPENVLPFRGRGFLGHVSYLLSGVKFCVLIVAFQGSGVLRQMHTTKFNEKI